MKNNKNCKIKLRHILIIAIGTLVTLTWNISYINKPKSYNPPTLVTYGEYKLQEDFFNTLLDSCNEYNIDIDLVLAIADHRSGINLHYDNNYGKGVMCMRPSTEEWVKKATNTTTDYIYNPKTAAKTAAYLVYYYMDRMDNVEDVIIAICGNETDTVTAVKDIYYINTGKELK